MTSAELEAERSEAVRRLAAMREFLPQISNVLDEIRDAVPRLFGPFYSRALTHADLSGGNVLLDERTWNITGILGWSGAAVRPFGVNLTSIFLSPHTDLESDADTSADADADADANANADDHVGRRSDSFRLKMSGSRTPSTNSSRTRSGLNSSMPSASGAKRLWSRICVNAYEVTLS